MADLPTFTAKERPVAHIVHNADLAVLRTQCGSYIVDCGDKHKAVSLSRILLRRKAIPIVHGSYSSGGQLLRSVRTLLEHANRQGDLNVYFIGADDGVFNDLWRRASWSSTNDPDHAAGKEVGKSGAVDASMLLMSLLPKEAETAGLASTYVGNSVEVRLVRQLILKARDLEEPVLIMGERGTGKELVARAIHEFRNGPFIHANCAAIENDMFDVEFFGVAPTKDEDAPSNRGLWRMAQYGTLYFDEINTLTIPQQIKIERAMTGTAGRDVRVAASASRDLLSMVEAEQFHESLYYHLRRFTIYTPALREHPQDIPGLANTAWRTITGDSRAILQDEVLERLEMQSWPGNVGELKAVLYQLHGLFGKGPIKSVHLDAVLRNNGRIPKPSTEDMALTHRLECMNHLRKATEVVRAVQVTMRPLLKKRNPTSDLVSSVNEQLLRRLTELDVLCLKPLRFGGHAMYAAVYELKGKLYYFCRQLQSDRKSAMRLWQSDLAKRFDSVTASLFDESTRLMKKTG